MIIVSKDGNCLATGTVTKKGGNIQYVGDKGIPKYKFSICIENKKGEDGKWQSKYIECELFGKKAEIAPRVSADNMVLCAGRLNTSTYKGRDGQEKTAHILSCDFVMVSGNAAQNAAQMPMQEPHGFQEMMDEDDDSETLPF